MVLETKIFETRDNIPKMQALSDAGKGQCCAKSGRSPHGAANQANRPEGELACTAQGRLPT
jgi:hypothetical protein